MKKFFLILAFFLLAFTCVSCGEGDTATFDINTVVFESQEFTYDGEKKYLDVTSELPEGVEYIITGNGQSKVGEYTVVVVFYDAEGNELGRKEAKLTIKSAGGNSGGNSNTGGNESTGGETGGSDSSNTIVVYFQNNWCWTDLYIYFFSEAGANNGEFPGVPLTTLVGQDGPEGVTYDIYKVEITLDSQYEGFVVSGNDSGKGGARNQTPNILFSSVAAGNCYYLTWDAANQCNGVGYFIYTPAA